MATEKTLFTVTGIADEDLSSYQFHFVKKTATGFALINSAAESKRAMGVLQNNPTEGQEALVMFHGKSKVVANAALAVGDKIKAEYVGAADNGKAQATTTDKDYVNGEVWAATTAEDELAEVILTHYTLSVT